MKIGYARCSTDKQELTAQREQLTELGCERIYLDEGLTGRDRLRPQLDQALAACRAGDVFVVTKLDRLGRSGRDLDDIATEVAAKGAMLAINGRVYDPADPFDKMFYSMLAAFAEFEVGLLRMRTREGMKIARDKGRLKGKPPKLSANQRSALLAMHKAGTHNIAELGAMFNVSRPTVYREIAKDAATNGHSLSNNAPSLSSENHDD